MLDASEKFAEQLSELTNAEPLSPPADAQQTTALVRSAIEELRFHMQRDGGDIELIEVDGDTVVVNLKGACIGCVLSSVTLAGIRKRLIDLVGRPLRVVPVSAWAKRRQTRTSQ